MHTEGEIKKAIKPLLDLYGELTTKEVKAKLSDVLEFDDDDKIMSVSRNEMRIIQRIGNIVSHQTEDIKIYSEGFAVIKKPAPAKFVLLKGTGTDIKPLSPKEITTHKQKARNFKPVKVDFDKIRERNNSIGNAGEEFVLEREKERVHALSPSDVDRVQHLSQKQGDGLGYDISSINDDGTLRLIEVKTTTNDKNTPFYMSENEKAFFTIHKDDNTAFIYRVYNFDPYTRRGDLEIIDAKTLLTEYVFDPISYKVSKK